MLVARQSFVAVYNGEPVAVHRGRTRVAADHELACRFPHRFEEVPTRQDAAVRFRSQLDEATSYDGYRSLLATFTGRLERVAERGEYRGRW